MTAQQTSGGLKPTRRTLVKGAAWSVPVVAMGAPAHALACSPNSCPPECIDTRFTGDSCKCPGAGNNWSYYLGFCFKNVCADPNSAPITLTVLGLTNNSGAGFNPSVTSPAQITLSPGEEACTLTTYHTSSSSAAKIHIRYALNGVEQPTPIELFAPPNCAEGTCPSDDAATNQLSGAEEPEAQGGELKAAQVSVPNLLGRPLEIAKAEVEALGLVLVSSGDGDIVVKQAPAAETQVDPGTEVAVTLGTLASFFGGNAEEETTVPDDDPAEQTPAAKETPTAEPPPPADQ